MENLKVYVKNEAESKEVQDLFFELGGDFYFGGKLHCNTHSRLVTINKDGLMANLEFCGFDYVEITLQQLRDLVVLKRNDVFDANYESENGDMENYKIKVNNWDESKEVQELYIALGATGSVRQITKKWVCLYYKQITFYDQLPNVDFKQVTLQHLRDLVVLKRNSIDDANFKDTFGDIWYVDSTNSYWMFENGVWREAEEPLFKLELIEKPIKKEGEVKMKEKEYIAKVSGDWRLVDSHELVSGRIEVPEGAEEYRANYRFYKNNGELFYSPEGGWTKSIMSEYKTLWQRNTSTLESRNTTTQDKLKFIEKWLNGEKIQYTLGVESEKTQWHNFTEGTMQYIKRSDIKFREAPKYVTINGIEFKTVESLLKHVKNNFDLEDGE